MTHQDKLREAADNIDNMLQDAKATGHVIDEDNDDLVLAANILRALASAQSDAGKGFDEWYTPPIPKIDINVSNRKLMRIAYLAGHAQGVTAGLAAQEAKVNELEAERDMYRDACQAYYDKQVAHNHKMENLPQIEKPKDMREGLLHLAGWFDALYDDEKDIEVSRDLRKWADDIAALATAKADALTLACAIRKMYSDEEYEHYERTHSYSSAEEYDTDIEQMRINRLADVTALLEKYSG